MNPPTRRALPGAARILPVLLLLAAVPARAQAVRVSEVEIRGNQGINKATIQSAISTRVGEEYSPERVARDRADIERLGWFQLVTDATQRVGNTIRVIFVVHEYPSVRQIEIGGSTLFTDEQLRAPLKTKTGQVFNRRDWLEDTASLLKLYTDRGYLPRFRDNTQPTDSEYADFRDRGILRLAAHELKIGAVEIRWPEREVKDKQGNVIRREKQHKTREYVVLRELSQRPGALYNLEQIRRDYRALSALGFFETINPVQTAGTEEDTVTITWELAERRTGQVSVGAGYSPRQQLIGRAELSDQNFRGKGQGVSIAAEIGTFGGDGAPSLELQFYEPWLTSTRTSMTLSLYDKLVYRFSRSLQDDFPDDDDRYFERRMGGQVSFGRPFRWPVTMGLRVDDVETGRLPRGISLPQQDGRVIAGNIGRIWNNRDYPNNPTSGSYARLSTEIGHADLDKNATDTFESSVFNKYVVDYRRYIRLKRLKATKEPEREQESQKSPVLAFRLMAGHVVGDIPFYEQFFMGGAESLRGYLEDRFWGNTMYLASVEYRRPIMNRIVGVLFADVGDAFGTRSEFEFDDKTGLATRFKQHKKLRPFASVGLGLRVATPIGPIRLDFGYGEEGGRTHFSIGHAF